MIVNLIDLQAIYLSTGTRFNLGGLGSGLEITLYKQGQKVWEFSTFKGDKLTPFPDILGFYTEGAKGIVADKVAINIYYPVGTPDIIGIILFIGAVDDPFGNRGIAQRFLWKGEIGGQWVSEVRELPKSANEPVTIIKTLTVRWLNPTPIPFKNLVLRAQAGNFSNDNPVPELGPGATVDSKHTFTLASGVYPIIVSAYSDNQLLASKQLQDIQVS